MNSSQVTIQFTQTHSLTIRINSNEINSSGIANRRKNDEKKEKFPKHKQTAQ